MMLNLSNTAANLLTGVLGQTGAAEKGADAAAAAQEAATASGLSGWALFGIFLAIVIVPFVLGWAIAKALKLPDTRTRIGVTILAIVIGLTPFVWSVVVGTTQHDLSVGASLRESIKLGVDLAGGTNLVYQVQETAEKEITPEIMDNMVGSITRRINPSGTEEVTVRRVGESRIEIIVPGADPGKVRRIKDRVTKLGSLEFDLLANSVNHRQWITEARELAGNERDVRQGDQVIATWKDVAKDTEGEWKLQSAPAVRYVNADGEILQNAPAEGAKGVMKQVLLILEPPEDRVTGEDIRSASVSSDQQGQPSVAFSLYSVGAQQFLQLTSDNLPNPATEFSSHLAIVLDGKVHSAPAIQGAISSQGQITGQFTREEVQELVNVLNAGALELPMDPEPVSEYTISPTLGEDTIKKAVSAILIAGALVLLITAGYYLLAGLVADFCLMLNLLLLLGIMSLIDATFTLPGLAGIVLTFGMAVDANVLIYERMREEITRGASLRLAIQNGFDRAFSAIVDSNVTTLITAVILYLIGTDAVKGFAVTLFIGIVVSLFTALYVARLMFDIIERKRWARTLKMFAILTNPQVNWLKNKLAIVGGSLLLLVIGVAMLAYRGPKMLDIDFLGGTMLTFQLTEPTTSGEIREVLDAVPAFDENVSVERLVLMGQESGEKGRLFRVRTTLQDADLESGGKGDVDVSRVVADSLAKAGLHIRRVTIDLSEVGPIPEQFRGGDFAEGSSVEITLDESGGQPQEFGVETVRFLVLDQLHQIQTEGHQKYEEIDDLIRVVGLAGSGKTAGETEAKTFSHFRVDVAAEIARADFQTALGALQTQLKDEPVFDLVNSFDSAVASDARQSAFLAILAAWAAMIGYLWFRFQDIAYGLAAVLAIVHDILITLGLLAIASFLAGPLGVSFLGLEEFKINLPMVAAVLTLIGYSVNDTIVVFDRIREVRGKNPGLTEDIVNTSLNQTLSRTILTSMTTLVVCIVLYFFGGSGIHGFTFILTIGIIVGTFSSIYISSPLLLWLINRRRSGSTKTSRKQREAVTS